MQFERFGDRALNVQLARRTSKASCQALVVIFDISLKESRVIKCQLLVPNAPTPFPSVGAPQLNANVPFYMEFSYKRYQSKFNII